MFHFSLCFSMKRTDNLHTNADAAKWNKEREDCVTAFRTLVSTFAAKQKKDIMGKENSVRIQTSLLNAGEKVVLKYLADRQPRWMTSDMLTYFGVFGSLVAALGYWLSNFNLNYLWLASLGFVIHWYGDSLDGTLARVRNLQRPVYGFFIDHTLDGLTTCILFIGTGLSPIFRMDIALLALAGYLLLSTYTYICTIIKGEFNLTYGGYFGPTEFRLLIIILNTLYLYTPWRHITYNAVGEVWSVYDIAGLAIAAILFVIQITQFLRDRAALAVKDPLKSYRPEK